MWLFEEVDLCCFLGCMKGCVPQNPMVFLTNKPSKKSISQINSDLISYRPGTPGFSKCLMLSKLEDPEVVPLEVLRAEARAHPHWRHVEMGGVCVSKMRALSGCS